MANQDPARRIPTDYIVFGQPKLTDEEIDAVSQTLRSGWIGTGPKSKEFESEFARYSGIGHSVATSSCTTALQLALASYGIGEGDEVITTAMTFAATINAIIHTGATPVIIDIDKKHLGLDLNQVESKISRKTKAIIPVHFAGAPVDLDGLMALRKKHGIKIIQDCAHAIETEWNGKKLAQFPDAACYSFYSTKNITTIEGGMICSDDQVFIERARLLVNHGMSKDAWKRFSSNGYSHYDVVTPGYKFNFTDVQATLGLLQLKDIESKYQRRHEVWKIYQKRFAQHGFVKPTDLGAPHRHALHLYTIFVDQETTGRTRDEWLSALHERGIGSGVHYRAIPQLTGYQKLFGWEPKDYPNAYWVGERTLSLPLTPYLSREQLDRITSCVDELASQSASDRVHKVALSAAKKK